MNKKPIIIGIGELLWDILPTGKKVGGAPVNFVYHATAAGAEAYAISAIGNDTLGDEILEEVKKIDINRLIERVDYPTGTVQVTLEAGIPDYNIIENVAWDHIPLTKPMEEIARKADAVCFGTLAQRSEVSRKNIQQLLSIVPEQALRVLDINLRPPHFSKEIIETSLKKCNILKINEEELEVLSSMFAIETDNVEESCRRFVEKFGLKMLILTAGADYSLIVSPEESSRIKTPNVSVVDTVGAGDSFTGTFIASLLQGKSLHQAHQAAVDRAAFVCSKAGAWV